MSTMPDPPVFVTAGVDTHRDSHTVAVLDGVGALLGTASFETTTTGYRRLLAWVESFGTVGAVGVEGTGSYGAGVTRHLQAVGVEVREVNRGNRQHRRRHGKSDPADALAAARAVLNGEASGAPRGGTGVVESLRVIGIARTSAMKQRSMVANQIKALVVTAPDELRSSLRDLTTAALAARAARYRPGNPTDPTQATKLALRALSKRWIALTEEITELDTHLEPVVEETAPAGLMEETGIGTQIAADLLVTAGSNPQRMRNGASFAALCGTSPRRRLHRAPGETPAQPGRGPPSQRRPLPGGHRPAPLPPTHPGLHGQAPRRRQNQKGGDPLSETSTRRHRLPAPHPPPTQHLTSIGASTRCSAAGPFPPAGGRKGLAAVCRLPSAVSLRAPASRGGRRSRLSAPASILVGSKR